MKKIYISPEMEIKNFVSEDIITTSVQSMNMINSTADADTDKDGAIIMDYNSFE